MAERLRLALSSLTGLPPSRLAQLALTAEPRGFSAGARSSGPSTTTAVAAAPPASSPTTSMGRSAWPPTDVTR